MTDVNKDFLEKYRQVMQDNSESLKGYTDDSQLLYDLPTGLLVTVDPKNIVYDNNDRVIGAKATVQMDMTDFATDKELNYIARGGYNLSDNPTYSENAFYSTKELQQMNGAMTPWEAENNRKAGDKTRVYHFNGEVSPEGSHHIKMDTIKLDNKEFGATRDLLTEQEIVKSMTKMFHDYCRDLNKDKKAIFDENYDVAHSNDAEIANGTAHDYAREYPDVDTQTMPAKEVRRIAKEAHSRMTDAMNNAPFEKLDYIIKNPEVDPNKMYSFIGEFSAPVGQDKAKMKLQFDESQKNPMAIAVGNDRITSYNPAMINSDAGYDRSFLNTLRALTNAGRVEAPMDDLQTDVDMDRGDPIMVHFQGHLTRSAHGDLVVNPKETINIVPDNRKLDDILEAQTDNIVLGKQAREAARAGKQYQVRELVALKQTALKDPAQAPNKELTVADIVDFDDDSAAVRVQKQLDHDLG